MPKRIPKVRIPIRNRGSLTQFGYRMRNPAKERHLSLLMAVKEYGVGETVKKLNVLAVFNKNNHPDLYQIAESDIKFVELLNERSR